MSTANKLTYLNGTKQAIKQAINEDFEVIDNNTTFREYAEEISSNNAKYKDLIPKETKNATNTLDISNSSGLDKALVTQYGNTYQEGEPTPDYPQEIQVVTGDNSIDVCGKNLLSTSFELGTIDAKGIPSGATNRARTGYMSLKENTTYSFSSTNSNIYYVPYYYNSSQTFISYNYGWKPQTTPFTTPSNTKYLRLLVKNNLTDTITLGEITQPQLEKGSTATTYEPYVSQNYPINLGSIELCKIDTYKDRIYPLNGKWYLEKKIGKVVFNGSENWTLGGNYNNIYQFDYSNSLIKKFGQSDNLSLFANYFGTTDRWNNSWTKDNIVFHRVNFNRIRLQSSNFTTIEALKAWLLTHNTEVYYVLATPTTTEITENNYPTLYNQLNNIKLFEGVNHITMTNERGLDVEFDITYYKDWKLD